MRPLFPFYGSKWRDARRYGAPGGHVIEPFAGSAGYATYWEPDRVTLIDADPIIVGVWDYLIGVTARELTRLPDVEVGQDVRDMGLPQEAAWLIGFWLNRGSSSPKRTRTAYSTRTDNGQLVWGLGARRRLAAEIHKVKRWTISQGDYSSAPEHLEATYFVDPPYTDKGRHYRVNTVCHTQLAQWAQRIDATVIVCEQSGADWLPFEHLAAIKSARGVSHEVVWRHLTQTARCAPRARSNQNFTTTTKSKEQQR